MLCGLWEAAKPHTLTLANRARANAGFDAITPASEVASFKTQRAGGVFGWGQHQFHKILRDKRWEVIPSSIFRFGVDAAFLGELGFEGIHRAVLMNAWPSERPTNRGQRVGKSLQRER